MSTVIIGASIAMLLYVLAAGLNIIFGMLGIANFAHGALYMLGAYGAYQMVLWTGSFWWALLIAPLAVGLASLALEVLTLRPVYRYEHYYQFLLTFGFVLAMEELVRILWGVDHKVVETPALLDGVMNVLGANISPYRLFVIAAGALIGLGLYLLLERSRYGKILRATTENPAMSACVGIDTGWVRTIAFAGGSALAALGGVLAAPMFSIMPSMGQEVIIDCFIVVVIGGLGNMRGTLVGALLLGMTRAFGLQYAPEWVNIMTYSLLIISLLLRPQGLFGVRRRSA